MTRSLLLLLMVAVAAGCGKKGPPLAPIIRIPDSVQKITATRMGNDVFVTFALPATNIDKSLPMDLGRIDVYGYTGRVAPGRARWGELGTVVATIEIPQPPEPDPAVSEKTAAAPGPPLPGGWLPGGEVTILDTLTPDEMVQGPLPPVEPRRDRELLPIVEPVGPPPPLRRFYIAIPFSTRGRNGPPGGQAELVLGPLPDAPTDLKAAYTRNGVSLTWEPSGGLLGFILNRALPPEPQPFIPAQQAPRVVTPVRAVPDAVAVLPSGPTTYNVYREAAADPFALPLKIEGLAGSTRPPVPMNDKPLEATTASDADVDFGRPRCYVVRAQRGAIMSEPSPPACFVPVDVFPPPTPSGLAAVASEGGITLIWEPIADPDIGGYLVLRREPGSATLRQLNDRPVREARYRDTTVQSGARYLYSVVAVDSQLPLPNVSAESERVEETAP
jgi:hypothetical protein